MAIEYFRDSVTVDAEVGCQFTDFHTGSVAPHQVVNLVEVQPVLNLPWGSKMDL